MAKIVGFILNYSPFTSIHKHDIATEGGKSLVKSLDGPALLYARSAVERKRDGRLGSFILLIQNFVLLISSPLLHSGGIAYSKVFLVIAAFSLLAVCGVKLPWERFDHRVNAFLTLAIFVELPMIGVRASGAATLLPLFVVVGFVYAGTVQDPRLLVVNGAVSFLSTFLYISVGSAVTWIIIGPISTVTGLLLAGALIYNRIVIERSDRIRSWQIGAMSEVGSTSYAYDTLAYVASACNQFLGGTGGVAATWLMGQGVGDVLVSTSFNDSELASLVTPDLVKGAEMESGFYIAAFSREYVFVENAAISKLDRKAYSVFKYSSVIFFPLKMGSNRVGSIAVYWHRWTPVPSEEVIEAIKSFLDEASRIVCAQLDREDLTLRLAIDELTRLQNRRSFFTALNSLEAGDSIIFLDLDYFKVLNDNLGHSEGDKELRSFGSVLNSLNRPGDVAARYGGEEFVLLLKNSNELDARLKVEQIRDAWSEIGRVTFSAGIATMVEGSNSAAVLICADRAMYRAKSNGRNRTETQGVSEFESEVGVEVTSQESSKTHFEHL